MTDKIIDMLFRTPEKWQHIREAARKLKISPNSIRKSINLLKKNGIIEEKKEGNMIRFRANLNGERYKYEKRVYNIRQVYDSGIVDFLYQYYNPRAIILFGSYSRGEDSSASDIDIAVMTDSKQRPDLTVFEKKISRTIQISLFTPKEVSDEFFNNLINGIVLKGFLKR